MVTMSNVSWALVVGGVCGALVQVIKTGKAAALLDKLGLPNVAQSSWMPRVAILLGGVIGAIEAFSAGGGVNECLLGAVNGAMAGALPVAVHEAARKAA